MKLFSKKGRSVTAPKAVKVAPAAEAERPPEPVKIPASPRAASYPIEKPAHSASRAGPRGIGGIGIRHIGLLAVFLVPSSVFGQPAIPPPPTTVYTRSLLRSTNAGIARTNLGILSTNGVVTGLMPDNTTAINNGDGSFTVIFPSQTNGFGNIVYSNATAFTTRAQSTNDAAYQASLATNGAIRGITTLSNIVLVTNEGVVAIGGTAVGGGGSFDTTVSNAYNGTFTGNGVALTNAAGQRFVAVANDLATNLTRYINATTREPYWIVQDLDPAPGKDFELLDGNGNVALLVYPKTVGSAGYIYYWGGQTNAAQSIRVGTSTAQLGIPRITVAFLEEEEEAFTFAFHTNDLTYYGGQSGYVEAPFLRFTNTGIFFGNISRQAFYQGSNVALRVGAVNIVNAETNAFRVNVSPSYFGKAGAVGELNVWSESDAAYFTLSAFDEAFTFNRALAVASPYGVSADNFFGSGASLTSLNASSLASGTVPDARLTGVSHTNAPYISVTNLVIEGSGPGTIQFQDAAGGEAVTLSAPTTLASNYSLTFPTTNGAAGNVLKLGASGQLYFDTATASGFDPTVSNTYNGTFIGNGASLTNVWSMTPLYFYILGNNIAAGTKYAPIGASIGSYTLQASALTMTVPSPSGGYLSNLWVRSSVAWPATTNMAFTIQTNRGLATPVDTLVTCTLDPQGGSSSTNSGTTAVALPIQSKTGDAYVMNLKIVVTTAVGPTVAPTLSGYVEWWHQ